ncbi:hypothetical protein [Sphaerimonospora thailandensis]|uniref:Uncharacterized protein n=1 Tax=Sphaerimonospora thailandensis TaxID=795644 RepID=A0A8J3R8M4_9ACTN|nr:hypothetical protein [Sphaerimonospora thailandensis]GIH69372.1 hypothetical protein Mth01_16250 [Sphaerimonospora thailandensis]
MARSSESTTERTCCSRLKDHHRLTCYGFPYGFKPPPDGRRRRGAFGRGRACGLFGPVPTAPPPAAPNGQTHDNCGKLDHQDDDRDTGHRDQKDAPQRAEVFFCLRRGSPAPR